MVIKRFGVLSVGKTLAVVYASLGLVIGAIIAIASLMGAALGSTLARSPRPFLGVIFGVGAVVFLPIFYGCLGFLGGILGSAVYNWVAGITGGIEVELR